MSEQRACIGIDLGGSSVKAIAFGPDGAERARSTETFDSENPLAWAELIKRLAPALASAAGETAPLGLSAPGLAKADATCIAHMPGRLQGLEGLDWTRLLDWPYPIPVLNDAHAALLGEWHLGAARGFHNVCMLTLGTGVGGAAIVDGRLLRGHIGRAGHLGHVTVQMDAPPDVTGAPGSIEWAIGNYSIQERSQGRFASTHQLLQSCADGNPEANELWIKSVQRLACGLNSIINVLDPQLILLGGGVARAGEALRSPLQKFLADYEWRAGGHCVEIRFASLGEHAGAIGAAQLARGLNPK